MQHTKESNSLTSQLISVPHFDFMVLLPNVPFLYYSGFLVFRFLIQYELCIVIVTNISPFEEHYQV